jgi:hypothetical protein
LLGVRLAQDKQSRWIMRGTKRDYWKIVEVVRRLEKGKTRRLMWAIALSQVFRKNDPMFEVQAFIDACATDEAENIVKVVELFSKRRRK